MKKLVAMLLCLAMLLSLTAFAAAEEKTTVVFWYSLEGTNAECIKQIVDDFNKSQDKIFVDAQYQGAYDDAINKLKAAGMGQLPCDIVHSYEIGTRFIIDSGWIVPVQEYIDKDNWDTSAIEPNLLAYYTVDGKINSMPFNCSTPLMYYNKTAFDEAGITEIPTTVDGILEIADKLTVKNPDGSIAVIHCTADLETGNGNPADGRKVKGTIHWVSAAHAVDAEVRLYDKLFTEANMNAIPEGSDYKDYLNPDSVVVCKGCKLEEALADAKPGDKFQFVRTGFFTPDSKNPGVYNRVVTLRDSFKPAK